MKRIGWIDTAKGILIILVVLGNSHVNSVFDVLINSFHMGAFFFLSGVTFHVSNEFRTFFRKKVKALLIPYFFFAFIMLAYDFCKTWIFSHGDFNLGSGLLSIIIPISGRNSTTTYGLWFLPCLFLTEVLAYGVIKIYHRQKVTGVISFCTVYVLCIALYKITDIASVVSILPFSMNFLLLGYFLRDSKHLFKMKKFLICLVTLLGWIFATGLNYWLCRHMFDLSSMSLGSWPLYFVSSFLGSIFIVGVSQILPEIKILQSLGKDSLYYYGLHYEVLGV